MFTCKEQSMVLSLSQYEKRESARQVRAGHILAGHHGQCIGKDQVKIINIDCGEHERRAFNAEKNGQ